MANNQYVNKVKLADGTTVIDISDTTATTNDVLSGQVFYGANGARSIGSVDLSDKVDITQTIESYTDLNTIVTSGFYRLTTNHPNAPANADYSQMIVSKGSDTIFQIVGIWGVGKVWTRTGNNIGTASATFTDWTELTNRVVKSGTTDQWINSGSGVTALGVANNQNGHYVSMICDGEGGNVKISKSNKTAEFDTYGMATDGSGYARIVVDNASSYKTFKLQQDGNFVDGNNVSTGGLNRDKLDSSALAIVQLTDTATLNISKEKYVIWKGSPYITTAAIANGDAFSTSSNMLAVSNGCLNDLAKNLTLKSYTGTTGTSLFQDMYYADISVSTGESSYGTIIGFYVDSVGNNHPAQAQRLANGSIRVYSKSSEKAFTLKVLFSKHTVIV